MYTPEFLKPTVLSVSQLTYYIKSLLEGDARLNTVFLAGEISNLTDHYRSGHIYLSLKDDKAIIKAVMFSGNASRLAFHPQDGMKVICRGRVAVYAPSGQYQLYIEDMQPDGVGALTLAYEQLKRKLEAKGLFDTAHKKPLPKFPETVGVITSPTGAAVQDIKNVLYRRFPMVNVIMCPVLVQGEKAAEQLATAVKLLDEKQLCDVIIIGRGGGSIEDLWAFNSEELAMTVYECETPVISAVGHETDFTICDFVSDRRAPTPSAAAELAVPDKSELLQYYLSQLQYLNAFAEGQLLSNKSLLESMERRLELFSPERKREEFLNIYKLYEIKLSSLIENKLNKHKRNTEAATAKLDVLNPLKVLSRGYSIVKKEGQLVSSVKKLSIGDNINIELSDGEISATVTGD